MSTSLSIDAYKRKQNVLAARKHKARSGVSGSSKGVGKQTYTAEQRRYLDACVENHSDPDARLLAALKEDKFVLKLDRFGEQELAFHMLFLQKTRRCKYISLSLGSIAINRDLRGKFERLGLKRAYAFSSPGAASVVRAACTAASKTPTLLRFHLIGVQISAEVAPLLSKAFYHCPDLEDISLSGANLGDDCFDTVAMALGKCRKLRMLSLAGCKLTDYARDHVAKIITLHGVTKDEAVWSSSLRGEVAPPVIPELLVNLSRNSLGDECIATICDALYNDKWLLGLNLGGNSISQQGIELLLDTLGKNNQTLAVLGLADMKEPVSPTVLSTFNSILRTRNRFLQQIAAESREKRMMLGALLLEWGVDKETVVETCYLESMDAEIPTKTNKRSAHAAVLVSPRSRVVESDHKSANQHSDTDNNDAESEHDGQEDTSQEIGHIKTIEYLIERLSALEADKKNTQAYVEKLEAENRQLRAELATRSQPLPPPAPALGISPIEAQIIAQLENSISSLAEQVEFMELEKQHLSSELRAPDAAS